LIVKINTKLATVVMYAMLHTDSGGVGVWEFPHPDDPVMINGQMVMPAFQITAGLQGDNVVIGIAQSNVSAPFLVDAAGMTLYISTNDNPGKSNCDANCRMQWLPLLVSGKLIAGKDVTPNKLGLVTLSDGSRQATYNGQPLYYYFEDINAGDVKGQGMDGVWFTATP
jgi:predicted lipoprotein with Yx(FWY)xxD motif